MGRYLGMGQLVTGHLEDDDRIIGDLAVVVQSRQADIADKQRRAVCAFGEDRVHEGRRRALALSAGDADDLSGELCEEELRHGGEFAAEILGYNAGTLDDIVVRVLVDLIALSLEYSEFADIAAGTDKLLRGLAFQAVAPQKNAFVFQDFCDLHRDFAS